MPHRHLNIKVPYGMALQPYADGSYNILYNSDDIIKLRDWAATLTNELTAAAVTHLQEKKEAEKQRKLDRLRKPIDHEPTINREISRVDNMIAMMGSDDLGEVARITPVSSSAPTMQTPPAEPEKLPLVESRPSRMVNTNRGKIAVAGDVSDHDLLTLGYQVVSDTADTEQPVSNGLGTGAEADQYRPEHAD